MPNSQNVNVLVVDDIENNLVAMQAVLDRPGVTVLNAASAVEALELLLKHEVALALLDVNMPEMDGFELAELMRGNPKTRAIPLIFVTAGANEPTRTFRGYQSGAVDFLNKPFDPDILRSKVDVFVELYNQRRQLTAQLAQLQEALRINELFTAVLGHDLRTPLSAVNIGAGLIQNTTTQPSLANAARLIQSSARRMERMINQLLDVAKTRSGQIALNVGAHDYREVCEQLIQELADPVDPRTIELKCEGETCALFDRDRVGQILSNLLSNALRHGVPATPVTIDIDGLQPQRVVIRVHNEGYIPPNDIAKIFEPYHSSHAGTSEHQGLGLGLYIVEQLVQAHAGTVAVRSTESDGTAFEVNLPRRV